MKYNFQLDFLNTIIILRDIQGQILNINKDVPNSFYQMKFLGNNLYYNIDNHSYWLKLTKMIPVEDCEVFQEEYIEVTNFLLENKKLINDLKKDPLTKIGNVAAIDAKEKEMLKNSKSYVLVICDVDDFKTINDTFGHSIGDRVLQGIARIFDKHRRSEQDLVSRVGGDEFFLIFETDDIETIIKKMNIIRNEIVEFGQELNISLSISIGISFFENRDIRSEIKFEELYKKKEEADQALYYVKKNTNNKNNIAYFNPNTHEFEIYHSKKVKIMKISK